MYGSGHVIDMITRMKNNRAIRGRRKFKDSNVEIFFRNQSKDKHILHFKKLSPEELAEIHKKHQLFAKKQRRKTRLVLSVFALVIIFVIFLIIRMVNAV